MITFQCMVCGVYSEGSKNKKYCSNKCKQIAYRTIKHPFSGKKIKVKSNIELLESAALALKCANSVDRIPDSHVLPRLIMILKSSGFNFESHHIEREDNEDEFFNEVLAAANFESGDDEKLDLYIALFGDGMVKVGVSKNPKERIKTIEHSSGRKCVKFSTLTFSRSLAFKVESMTLSFFRSFSCGGEWLEANYDAVKEKAYQYAETISFARLN